MVFKKIVEVYNRVDMEVFSRFIKKNNGSQ